MKQHLNLTIWPRFQVEKKNTKNSYRLILKFVTFPKILQYKKVNSLRCLEFGFTLSGSRT